MRMEMKKWIGRYVVKMGGRSVEKSMVMGLYDPKIPEELKEVAQKSECRSRK